MSENVGCSLDCHYGLGDGKRCEQDGRSGRQDWGGDIERRFHADSFEATFCSDQTIKYTNFVKPTIL